MRFVQKFSRFKTDPGTALGSDTVPNGTNGAVGTPPAGQDKVLSARVFADNGNAIRRVVVAYNYIGAGAASPLTSYLYAWDGTSQRWYLLDTRTLTAGQIQYFQAAALVEQAVTNNTLSSPTQGTLDVMLIVDDTGGLAPVGEHVFTMSADTASSPVGGPTDEIVAAGSGVTVTEAPPNTYTVAADFGSGAGKVLQATKAAIETVLAFGSGFVKATAGVLTVAALAASDIPAPAGDVTGTYAATTVVNLTGSAGLVTVPTANITFGATPATSGTLRFTDGGSLRADNGGGTSSSINIASWSLGTVTFGGATNTVAHVHNVKTAGTHTFQVNSTLCATIGAGFVSIGSAAVAAAGDLRLSATGSIKALNGSSADINVISCSAGIFTYGGTVNTGMVYGTSTSGTHTFQVNAVTAIQVGASTAASATTMAATGCVRFRNGDLMLTMRNTGDSADLPILSSPAANTIHIGTGITPAAGGAAIKIFSSSTGIQLFPNTATAASAFSFTVDTLTFGASMSNPALAYGAVPASTGFMRAANATTIAAGRNAANSANFGLLGLSSGDIFYVGADSAGANGPTNTVVNGNTSVLLATGGSTRATVGSSSLQMHVGTIQWLNSVAPIMTGLARTTDAAAQIMTIVASDAWSSATGANQNGAYVLIQGGKSTTEGSAGLRKGVRVALSSTGIVMFEATEVIAAFRKTALNMATALTATSAPANTGDLVTLVGNAATVPTAPAVGAGISYSNAGAGSWFGTAGTATAYAPA